jgi:beta-glucosidase
MIEFPNDFFWGAATSAYQVEGNNNRSDWWEWERRLGLAASGNACRHYELYKEDFDLARSLSHNCHRLSVEWSRIEPEENIYLDQEIAHYQDVVSYLRQLNIEPVVTLQHFTIPLWFARLGGWESKSAVKFALRFSEKIVRALADNVRFWVTLNEPLVYVYHAYILGFWPPQVKSFSRARRVRDNLIAYHVQAHRLIHGIYAEKNLKPIYVSIAKNMQAFCPCGRSALNKFAAYLRSRNFNFFILDRLMRQRSLDFIGLNYYTRSLVDARGWLRKNLFLDVAASDKALLPKNSLGWEVYPEGLYDTLMGLKRYATAVFILENGFCSSDDALRWEFISAHLKSIYQAISEGSKVIGYLYWSLIDNFEWDKGFGPRFGLIEVDYRTYQRKARQSAWKFAQVCKTGKLE